MLGLRARPRLEGIAAVHASCERLERLLRGLQLARRDRQQAIDRHRQPFLQPELLLELVLAQPERGARFRRQLGFEVLHVRPDGLRRFGLCIGEVAEQMQVVNIFEGARQLFLDELERPAHRFDADLDVDAGRVLDVVARGLHQPGRLAQLRQHAAGAFRRRRVGKERLSGKARRQQVRVVLRVLLPRAHRLELEHAPLQVRREHPMLETLHRRQGIAVDFVEAAEVPGQRVRLGVNRLTADVLQQVVVRVHAVQRGVRGMGLVQVTEQVVDEMRQGLGSNHLF